MKSSYLNNTGPMSTSDSSVTFLPNAPPVEVAPGITVQPPLSRRGTGPPLVVLVDGGVDLGRHEKTVDPPPLLKWAEEGFAVAQIVREEDDSAIQSRLQLAVEQLTRLSECEAKNGVALLSKCPTRISRCIPAECYVVYSEMVGEWINDAIRALPGLSVVVSYGCSFKGVVVPVPSIAHIPTPIGQTELPQTTATSGITIHTYHGVGAFFAIPAHTNYRAGAAGLAHSRSLAFVKDGLGGPHFDLATIWDEHTRFEFADRSVARTMATMVAEPYVNHIPTLTGGVGRRHLTAFYRDHFIFSNPADTELELVSRTVGTDRIVDEFLFKCTHDRVIDWL